MEDLKRELFEKNIAVQTRLYTTTLVFIPISIANCSIA